MKPKDIIEAQSKFISPKHIGHSANIHLETLNGEFGEIQTKNFLNKYDLLKHCPNTNSGFSATLFKNTKADSKDSEYISQLRFS